VLYTIWERSGKQSTGVKELSNNTILLTSPDAKLQNLRFEPSEYATMSVCFNYLTRAVAPTPLSTLDVTQTDVSTGDIIGGEVYNVYKSNRKKLFYANAGEDIYAFQEEAITLTAKNIGEPAQYRWYDREGNLVGEGMVFTTVAREEQQYRLEVIALSDGYKDYDEVWVRIVPGKIESILPNPARDRVTVTCVYNNVSEARIVISDQFGKIYAEYPLGTSFIGDLPVSRGSQSVDFDVFRYTPGTYIVTLVCDGQVSDNKTFVKE